STFGLGALLGMALAFVGMNAYAQEPVQVAQTVPASAPEQDPNAKNKSEATELELIEVTGSRIMREEYYANSPVSTVTRDQIDSAGDVTLEQYLQTLPQINPTF